MIELRYTLKHADFELDLSEQLPATGVTAIYGHSGCGKSSVLRCIAGLESPQHAYLAVNGEVWEDSKQQIAMPTHKRPIGYVFQEASLFEHLSVMKNLQYGASRCGHPNAQQALEQAVELLGIERLLERMPERLSGGERQRVAIARALAVCPKLLLMDEPLASLDIRRKREILPFLERLHRELEMPVLYVSHAPAEVRRLADHLLIMDDGKVTVSGDMQSTQHYLLEDERY
ncbi:molybdenum ABC transporter ATP-binding protein [Leucothrix sargassi]|nr:molybdenum ABC transporter ATP-binding protein [Leucothrix sargassi]